MNGLTVRGAASYFDRHELAFVYDNEDKPDSGGRYRLVKFDDWKQVIG